MNRHRHYYTPAQTRFVLLPLLTVVSAAILGASAARDIGPAPTALASHAESTPALAPGEATLRATIDPETGAITVSSVPSDLALDPETKNALRRDDKGLTQVYHPDGTVSMDLQGRYQSTAVARIGENGVVTICTETAEGSAKVLRHHDVEAHDHDAQVKAPTAEVK